MPAKHERHGPVFWSENRRVSNRLLCQELGYKLLHPHYRLGLRDCLRQSV